MQTEIVNKIHERFLKEFMDILIILKMKEGEVSGYDVLTYFHRKFGFLVSAGTVYSILYSMERDGLIKARQEERRRVYSLTIKGEENVRAIYQSTDILENSFTKLLKPKIRNA